MPATFVTPEILWALLVWLASAAFMGIGAALVGLVAVAICALWLVIPGGALLVFTWTWFV